MKYHLFYPHPAVQLKSNPSEKDEKEAQSQLMKSDEIQRLVVQAQAHFNGKDYSTAVMYLDQIIEVRNPKQSTAILPLYHGNSDFIPT